VNESVDISRELYVEKYFVTVA